MQFLKTNWTNVQFCRKQSFTDRKLKFIQIHPSQIQIKFPFYPSFLCS